MANVKGSVISRIVEGMLDLSVEFRYEAEYEYEVVEREFLEKNMGGKPPADLLDNTVTLNFMRAFERSYPDGLSPAEAEQPDENLLMRNLKELVDEKWKRFCGIALSSFTLKSFKMDPASQTMIRQMLPMMESPQEMAQEMVRKMQAAKEEAAAVRKIKCAYCASVVTLKPDGSCPSCGAPLE